LTARRCSIIYASLPMAAENRSYRWLLVVALLAGIGAAAWQALPKKAPPVKAGSSVIDFALPDLAGTTRHFPRGDVVLLNFWATWCPPCRQEIPSMVKLHHLLAPEGLKIVAVSVDQDRQQLTDFVREYQMPFQVLHDADSAVSHRYGVFRYPESFLIDRNGKVRYHLVGAMDWMGDEVITTIRGMLKPLQHETRGVRKDKVPRN